MILQLNGLDVDCVIGERADERARVQRLRVDAILTVDDRVATSDALSDAADYAKLADEIRSTLVAARCQMIEHAAKVAADVCCRDAHVRHVRVSVTKAGAVLHLASATATYERNGDE